MVSIVAFQAVDPGSIPGRRTFLTTLPFPSIVRNFYKIFMLGELRGFFYVRANYEVIPLYLSQDRFVPLALGRKFRLRVLSTAKGINFCTYTKTCTVQRPVGLGV